MPSLLRAIGVSKSYGGIQALRSVDFDLHPGEVHALVGENGAGKSTLIRIFSGAVEPDNGSIELDGTTAVLSDPLAAKALGIAVIYQQPALFPDLTVAENIGLALEKPGAWSTIDWKQRRQRAAELLRTMGARISPEALCRDLSMPEQQLVEIAKSIGANARVLILDEPTASLSEREVDKLFVVLRSMKDRGVGIVYVSHRLEELPRIANRVTVLRDGAGIQTAAMGETTRDGLIRMMVGREIVSVFPKRKVPLGGVVLETRDFSVRAGEIVGLAGLVGAGRTEFAEALFGLRPARMGSILLHGKEVLVHSPEEAVRLGIAYVPEDRRRNGLILEMPVTTNITLALLSEKRGLDFIDAAREREIAASYAARLAIKTPSVISPAKSLSGGNQQKVSLSRWLAVKPSLLILDEPTQGVDVGAKAEIHKLLGDLAAGGMAILMISSELQEILGMSDRIAVMRAGAVAGVLHRSAATERSVMALALGTPE